MKVTTIGAPEIVMQNPDSIHNYFAWPTVTKLQNGRLAAVASGFRIGHLCPFGKSVISYSEDDGKTWTLPATVIDTPLDDRDSGILPFGETGVIVTSFNSTVAFLESIAARFKPGMCMGDYFRGRIGMITPEAEKKYLGSHFRISNDCGVTFGPICKCPVSSPHGPCELPDGTILWVGWEHGKSNKDKGEHEFIQAYKINPDGTSEYMGEIAPIDIDGVPVNSQEPHAFALDDGTVICHIRVDDSKWPNEVFTTYQSVSTDGGRTWSKPEALLPIRGGAPAHIMKHSSGVLISSYSYREAPYGIKAMFSTDNGKTWDTDHNIYSNEHDFDIGYPSTVELSDGSLLTVFYAHAEKDGPAVIMQQRWRFEK